MNIEDDIEYFSGSSFFLQNIGKLMTIENFTLDEKDKNLSRNHKNKLTFQENTEPLDIIIESDIIESDDEEILNLNSNSTLNLNLIETAIENSITLPEEIFNLTLGGENSYL